MGPVRFAQRSRLGGLSKYKAFVKERRKGRLAVLGPSRNEQIFALLTSIGQ
jgi:hypothetical protein